MVEGSKEIKTVGLIMLDVAAVRSSLDELEKLRGRV